MHQCLVLGFKILNMLYCDINTCFPVSNILCSCWWSWKCLKICIPSLGLHSIIWTIFSSSAILHHVRQSTEEGALQNELKSKSKSRCNWQSVSMSRCRAHSGTCDQILLSIQRLLSESCCRVSVGLPLSREVRSVICHSQSVVIYQYVHQGFTFQVFYSSAMHLQYIQSFFQSRLATADYAVLVTISSNYHSSLDTWTVA
jgi:hypothetical protein